MRIRSVEKGKPKAEFRPLYPIFDECRRINHGHGQLVNVSWVARSIQSALNAGTNCENIHRTTAPASELAKLMDGSQIDRYRAYASQLSRYDCGEPVIVIYEGRKPPDHFDPKTCEILNGKARVVRALSGNIIVPVILISKARARFWGMPPWARRLGASDGPSIRIDRKRRTGRLRSGAETLPHGSEPGGAVITRRVKNAKRGLNGRVTNPFGFGLVPAASDKRERKALQWLQSRALRPRGLINIFPHPDKPGEALKQTQETCLKILLGKLLCDGLSISALRETMRQLLKITFTQDARDDQEATIDETLTKYAKEARATLRSAGTPWNEPLSERLLLFGATLHPRSVQGLAKGDVLSQHKLELMDWTLRALFRATHWRRGSKSALRLNHEGNFLKSNKQDSTAETRDRQRLHHDVAGSAHSQGVIDLEMESMLILAMHARFNPFLIWHDLRWAVPLGHWAMAITDLDAGRETHVTVWMAELYEEQRRRQFKHKNHFTGPATMMVHWLHWVCGDIQDFSPRIAEICGAVIDGFPGRSGRLIEIKADQHGVKRLDAAPLKYQEDWALQAMLFA